MILKISPDAILIDGLSLYESVLLYFGILVLLLLIVSIVILVAKGRKVPRSFIAFFAGAVIMIAFPGIQEISYKNLTIILREKNRELLTGSDQKENKQELEKIVNRLENKNIRSSDNLTEMAMAKTLLGNYEEGISYAGKALKQDRTNQKADEVIKLARGSAAIEGLIDNPESEEAQENVRVNIDRLKDVSFKGNYVDMKIAEAYLLTGNTVEAKRNAQKILDRKPSDSTAMEILNYASNSERLKEAIENGNVQQSKNIAESISAKSASDGKSQNFGKAVIQVAVKTAKQRPGYFIHTDSVLPQLHIDQPILTQ
ncbi:tetratricopeptide repeat protein [Saccharicrinis sp. FJH54]|uniref:tetratricopeptide repeat protein n=1 Tax=Saccharicrinis sp. FJH54 TaxID=3344665 RepID=UPI0035D4B933